MPRPPFILSFTFLALSLKDVFIYNDVARIQDNGVEGLAVRFQFEEQGVGSDLDVESQRSRHALSPAPHHRHAQRLV